MRPREERTWKDGFEAAQSAQKSDPRFQPTTEASFAALREAFMAELVKPGLSEEIQRKMEKRFTLFANGCDPAKAIDGRPVSVLATRAQLASFEKSTLEEIQKGSFDTLIPTGERDSLSTKMGDVFFVAQFAFNNALKSTGVSGPGQ